MWKTSLAIALLVGCSDSGGAPPDGGPPDGGDGGVTVDAGEETGCYEFGRWPAPVTTVTIPYSAKNAEGGLYYTDIQAAFPQTDWSTVDRLYIEAGQYAYISIGNLPNRTPEDPLVITNKGGQVHIGPAPSAQFGYLWIMDGGSNWVLTGRYDPVSQTGDEGFQGHRCGAYANSQGTYGFVSDDEMMNLHTTHNHMGLNVSADAFELEWMEIRRSSFAGIRISKPDVTVASGDPPPSPFNDVIVHDMYIHDTGGEGLYFGMTSGSPYLHAKFVRLHLYNNRILRTANEVAQLQHLASGSRIHNNVFAWGGMQWRNAFAEHQDNGSQHVFRTGDVEIRQNIYLRGMESLLNFFGAPEPGDASGTVTLADNYFSDAMWLGIYFGGPGQTAETAISYAFTGNVFRNLDPTEKYGYFEAPYYSARMPSTTLLTLGTSWTAPISFVGNTWSGARTLAFGSPAYLTQSGNTSGGAVEAVQFVNTGLPAGTDDRALEFWTATTGAWAGNNPVTYAAGTMVFDEGRMYRALTATSANDPAPSTSLGGTWEDLGEPADDVRLVRGSPHEGRGLLDRP